MLNTFAVHCASLNICNSSQNINKKFIENFKSKHVCNCIQYWNKYKKCITSVKYMHK